MTESRDGVLSPVAHIELRDYFAGQALAGMLAGGRANTDRGTLNDGILAEHAYRFADAMLAERKKRQ